MYITGTVPNCVPNVAVICCLHPYYLFQVILTWALHSCCSLVVHGSSSSPFSFFNSSFFISFPPSLFLLILSLPTFPFLLFFHSHKSKPGSFTGFSSAPPLCYTPTSDCSVLNSHKSNYSDSKAQMMTCQPPVDTAYFHSPPSFVKAVFSGTTIPL